MPGDRAFPFLLPVRRFGGDRGGDCRYDFHGESAARFAMGCAHGVAMLTEFPLRPKRGARRRISTAFDRPASIVKTQNPTPLVCGVGLLSGRDGRFMQA